MRRTETDDPVGRASGEPLRHDDSVACAGCGRFGAFGFDGRVLCADCYQAGCSCCPEFGDDELPVCPEKNGSS